jgi:hypothetical protein
MTDYPHGETVPATEAVDYVLKCVDSKLAAEIANLIQRQGVTSTDIICATLTQLITFYLDTSSPSTEHAKTKARLFYYTMITLDMSRAVQDAIKESEHATAH